MFIGEMRREKKIRKKMERRRNSEKNISCKLGKRRGVLA